MNTCCNKTYREFIKECLICGKPFNQMTTIIEDIVKEFDEMEDLFSESIEYSGEIEKNVTKQVRDFIISSLNKVIEERDRMLLEEIEKMKVVVREPTNEPPEDPMIAADQAYNHALSSIAEFIKNNNK